MKIRIKGNSVRLRLGMSEVARFAETGVLTEETHFISGMLSYVLKKTNDGVVRADISGSEITVFVPEAISNQWIGSDLVGFQEKMPLPNGESLFILVEKDFVCLDNTFEDQSDNYPNPNAAC